MHREGPNRHFVHLTRSCGSRRKMAAREGKRRGRARSLLRAPCSAPSTRSGRRSSHFVLVRAAARWTERCGRQGSFHRAYARPRPSESRSLTSRDRVLSGAVFSAAKVAKRSIAPIYHPISTLDRYRRSPHRSLVAIDPRGRGSDAYNIRPRGGGSHGLQIGPQGRRFRCVCARSPPPHRRRPLAGPRGANAAPAPPPRPCSRLRHLVSSSGDRCADKPKRFCCARGVARPQLAHTRTLRCCGRARASALLGLSLAVGRACRRAYFIRKGVPILRAIAAQRPDRSTGAPSHAARPQIASAWSIGPGSPTRTGDRARARRLRPPYGSPGGHDSQAQSLYALRSRPKRQGRSMTFAQGIRNARYRL